MALIGLTYSCAKWILIPANYTVSFSRLDRKILDSFSPIRLKYFTIETRFK